MIDVSVIEHEQRGCKRRHTDTGFQFRRVQNVERVLPASGFSNDSNEFPKVGSVDSIPETRIGQSPTETNVSLTSQEAHLVGARRSSPKARKVSSGNFSRESRRFHLTREHHVSSPRNLPTGRGIQKPKHRSRSGLATFSEPRKAKVSSRKKPTANASRTASGVPDEMETDLDDTTPHRKKPNAGSAERKWREENWGRTPEERRLRMEQRSGHGNSLESEDKSLQLAMELQDFALQETIKQQTQAASARKPLKFAPRPPPPRYHERHPPMEESTDAMMVGESSSDEEWVYDTYVRQPQSADRPAFSHPVDYEQHVAGGRGNHPLENVGYLVIRDVDEEEWEAFEENDQEDEEDGHSDDEDENGKGLSFRNVCVALVAGVVAERLGKRGANFGFGSRGPLRE